MTTLTPTSDSGAAALDTAIGLPGQTGPLDIVALSSLADQFFRSLPGSIGGAPTPVNVLPGGTNLGPLANGPQLPGTLAPGANLAPTSPQSGLALVSSTPALLPHAVALNGLPENAAIIPPTLDTRVGGQSLGVPQAPAAAFDQPVPRAAPASVPSNASFYFLDSVSGVPVAPTPATPVSDLTVIKSFGLPGDAELRALLQQPLQDSQRSSSSPTYYFVPARPATPEVPALSQSTRPIFDVHAVRRDFPVLQERVNGHQLAWFDNAATTQKPQAVIDRLAYFYAHENSNIHRAAHELAARATDAYEKAREKVRGFLGAGSVDEIIFVRGATEAINLVAKTWGAKHVGEGDEIIVSHLEHHANIVPWQQLAAEKGARIKVIPVDDTGQVLLEEYQRLLTDKTTIVAVTQVSNALGTVVPVKEIVALAHRAGAVALVDGAQSVSHKRVDVRDIGADFFVFSGHKVFAPTGIGVVYGRKELLEEMPPWQGGGNMIADVTFERTSFQPPPNKFEAGTGNIADAVGLGAAIDYVQRIGLETIDAYEHALLGYATERLAPIPGVRLIGTAAEKASVLSFVLNGYTTEQVGRALNEEGIAVRAGHHCAQPILRRFGVEATVRPSLAFYNTCEEVDRFISVVRRLAWA